MGSFVTLSLEGHSQVTSTSCTVTSYDDELVCVVDLQALIHLVVSS